MECLRPAAASLTAALRVGALLPEPVSWGGLDVAIQDLIPTLPESKLAPLGAGVAAGGIGAGGWLKRRTRRGTQRERIR